MPVFPALDSLGFVGLLRCPSGHEHGALLMAPTPQRSLSMLAHIAHELPAQPCPDCDAPLTVAELRYTFDEPDLPDLIYDPASGALTCDDQPVESEQDLVDRIGRPFSVADHHRVRLLAITEPDAYRTSEGIITQAAPASPDDTPEQTAERFLQMTRKGMPLALASLGDAARAVAPIPLGWHRDHSAAAWLGPAADKLRAGELLVQTLGRADLLVEALARYQPAEPDAASAPLTFGVDEHDRTLTPWAKLDELRTELDLEAFCELTVTKALTVHEAAAYAYHDTAELLDTVQQAISQLDPALLADFELADGLRLTHRTSGQGMDLEVMAQQVGRDPEQLRDRVRDRLAGGAGTPDKPADRMPCGCDPHWGVVLRPASVASDDLAYSAYHQHIVCPVMDCEHHNAFVHGDAGDSLWQRAQHGMATQQFRLHLRGVYDLSGEPVGIVAVGHDAASVACDGRWARQLADRAGLPMGEGTLTVMCATTDLAAVGAPGCDAELLERELAAIARDAARNQHIRAPAVPLTVTFAATGEQFGQFLLDEFVAHPIERIMRG